MTRLTPRQEEIVLALADGERRKDIALRLGISLKTVNEHIYASSLRYRVHTTAGLVGRVLREEVVAPDR